MSKFTTFLPNMPLLSSSVTESLVVVVVMSNVDESVVATGASNSFTSKANGDDLIDTHCCTLPKSAVAPLNMPGGMRPLESITVNGNLDQIKS